MVNITDSKVIRIYVDDSTKEMVQNAASKMKVSESTWARLAVMEKLNEGDRLAERRCRDNLHKCRSVAYERYGFSIAEIEKCGNNLIPDLGCEGCPARDEQRNFIEGWKTK